MLCVEAVIVFAVGALQVDIITAQGSYTERDAAAAVRTMLEVRRPGTAAHACAHCPAANTYLT
jgi:hypothetical protein